MPDLIGHICSYLVVPAIFEPDLQEALLGPQGQRCADDLGLLELLTDHGKEGRLPHLIDVVVLLYFYNPDASKGRLLICTKVSLLK